MSKKNISYLLSICAVTSAVLPFSASAVSISGEASGGANISAAQRAGANSALEVALNTSFGSDTNVKLGNSKVNVRGDTKVENSIRLDSSSNDDKDKKDKNDKKENNKSEEKNNRGAWISWFNRFFGRINGDIKVSVTGERENATSTVISWKTDEETKGKIYFTSNANLSSTASTSGFSVVENTDFSLDHNSTLSNLSANTKYYYFIEYQGRDGKVWRSKVFDFKTKAIVNVDVTAPRILFSTSLNVTETSAHILWVTNESSKSTIWISNQAGVSTTGTPTKVSGSMSVFHSANLSGLASGKKYFYIVGSTDASGNTVFSSESSFETSAQ